MKTEEMLVNAIVVGPKHRSVVEAAVGEIAKSVKEIGLTNPISVRRMEGGRPYLIAGRQRLEAFKKLKRPTIRVIVFGDNDIQAELRELDENLCRANLSPAEEAEHHHRRKQLYEAEHPETKQGAAPAKRQKGTRGGKVAGSATLPRYTRDAAVKTGKSERTTQKQTRRGEVLGGVALNKIKGTVLDKPEQLDALVDLHEMPAAGPAVVEKLAADAASGKKVNAKVERDKLKRSGRALAQATQIKAAAETLGQQLYGIIIADPPWSRETWSEGGKSRDPANHYPTQNEAALEQLTPPAATNCVLFLWTTQEHLAQAMRLLEAWGFTYKSGAVWVKPKISTGYWFRTKHELVLVATKGEPVAPAPGTQMDSVFEAPVGRHSEKPVTIHEMIERLWPDTPKLEMFARAKRAGWNSWGGEVTNETSNPTS